MEFSKLVKSRRSIRKFKAQPVEGKIVDEILQDLLLAPSAGNLQSYKVYVVKDDEVKARLAEAAFGQGFIKDAPCVLVFCADPKQSSSKYGERGSELYSIQDAAIACAYAQLAVADKGLGAVWVGAFDEEKAKQALGIEPSSTLRPVSILPIGYPDEKPKARPRRPENEMVKEA